MKDLGAVGATGFQGNPPENLSFTSVCAIAEADGSTVPLDQQGLLVVGATRTLC
jgi:hypothetical protein